jgi:hypothetical protein
VVFFVVVFVTFFLSRAVVVLVLVLVVPVVPVVLCLPCDPYFVMLNMRSVELLIGGL